MRANRPLPLPTIVIRISCRPFAPPHHALHFGSRNCIERHHPEAFQDDADVLLHRVHGYVDVGDETCSSDIAAGARDL